MTAAEEAKKKIGGAKMEDTEFIVEEFILSIFVRVDKTEREAEQVTK